MMKTDTSTQDATGVSTLHRLAWRLPPRTGARRRAFTRLELLVVLASLALFMACVALPALANNRQGSERAVCANNLRQIGQAFQLWGMDNNEMNPWRVSLPQGTADAALRTVLWFHFSWVSNQLASPKFLACPADREARVAQDWLYSPNSGYLNPAFQNQATSYFLGLHAASDYPLSILAGDRNLRVSRALALCNNTGIPGPGEVSRPYDKLAWANLLHGESGNLLLTSGSVLQISRGGLGAALTNSEPPFSRMHFKFPGTPYVAEP